MIIIIGAGLSGLSAGFHLGKKEYLIVEKDKLPGGLCKTKEVGDFQFDLGGHFLHFKDTAIKEWVKELMGENLKEYRRKAFVFSHNVLTPYPFQVFTYGLPKDVIHDCITGFMEVTVKPKENNEDNFEKWILKNFGQGFAKHFFFPFNKKFWRIELKELDSEWASWSIPKPTMQEVFEGAMGSRKRDYGYNISFFYPRAGGISALVRALAKELALVELNREVIEVHHKERSITLSNGERLNYSALISTMPLKELVSIIVDAPVEIKELASRLRYISVFLVELGITGNNLGDFHWVYFPEDSYLFYRAVQLSMTQETKENNYSVLLEISHLPGEENELEDEYLKQSIFDFQKGGFLSETNEVVYKGTEKIKYAYVIYDHFRKKNLKKIISFLEDNKIYPIGRYGRWQYSTMETALKEGKEVAEKIKKE